MSCTSAERHPCRPSGSPGQPLEALVTHFKRFRQRDSERELEFFRSMPSFDLAVHHAGTATDKRGKRFGHQCRITRASLRAALNELRRLSGQVRTCRDFSELHTLLQHRIGRIYGIGPLFVYDTALRLGAFLALFPTSVYLHAGTRAGAAALALNVARPSIPLSELPTELHGLAAHEIEDFLCVYKSQLSG